VVELSEVSVIEDGVLGVIGGLQRWAQDRGIEFKVFSPSKPLRDRLRNANSMSEFDIPSLHELMGQLTQMERQIVFE
jgi:anti-anti-sigma regulatory factor